MHEDIADNQRQLEAVREELVRFQDAARLLELQKLENGKLKETVDSLKLEVESLTQRVRLGASSQLDLRSGSSSSDAGHVRSLGSELGSELESFDENTSSEGSETEDETEHAPDGSRGDDSATARSLRSRRHLSSRQNQETKTIERHIIYRTRNVVSPILSTQPHGQLADAPANVGRQLCFSPQRRSKYRACV